jgi:hypothetical protein
MGVLQVAWATSVGNVVTWGLIKVFFEQKRPEGTISIKRWHNYKEDPKNNLVLEFYKDPRRGAKQRPGPSSPSLECHDLDRWPLAAMPETTPLGSPLGWIAVSRSKILRIGTKSWRKRELLGAWTPEVR